MILILLSLVLGVNSVEIEVKGDITFDIKIDNVKVNSIEEDHVMKTNVKDDKVGDTREKRARPRGITQAEPVQCVYQYPERPQVEAILSNMMNQLTKVYTRVQEYVSEMGRRGTESRFRVVPAHNETTFDEIYANMTEEFRDMYNITTERVPRTLDPCEAQPVLKGAWSRLVDSSIAMLRKAALRSLGYVLRMNPLAVKKKNELNKMVDREMVRVRSTHLDTLCDEFQLCFNDLL